MKRIIGIIIMIGIVAIPFTNEGVVYAEDDLSIDYFSDEELERKTNELIDDFFMVDNTLVYSQDGQNRTKEVKELLNDNYENGDYKGVKEYITSNNLVMLQSTQYESPSLRASSTKINNYANKFFGTEANQYLEYVYSGQVTYDMSTLKATSWKLTCRITTGRNYNHIGHDLNYYKAYQGVTNKQRYFEFRPYVSWSDGSYFFCPIKYVMVVNTNTNVQPAVTTKFLWV